MSRLLTRSEQANLLWRHPLLAAQVAATKTLLNTIGYDLLDSPPAWYEFDIDAGLLPPQGVEVNDSVLGRVLVQPAPNGEIYFNVDYTPVAGALGPRPYVDPTPAVNPFADLQEILLSATGLLLVGYLVLKRL